MRRCQWRRRRALVPSCCGPSRRRRPHGWSVRRNRKPHVYVQRDRRFDRGRVIGPLLYGIECRLPQHRDRGTEAGVRHTSVGAHRDLNPHSALNARLSRLLRINRLHMLDLRQPGCCRFYNLDRALRALKGEGRSWYSKKGDKKKRTEESHSPPRWLRSARRLVAASSRPKPTSLGTLKS